MATARWDALEWQSDDHLTLDGVRFRLTLTDYHIPSTPQEFVLLKDKRFLEHYREILEPIDAQRIFEVGFFRGASTAFFDLVLWPQRLVCVDQVPEAPVLKHYLSTHGRTTVLPYFEVDQGDKIAVSRILEKEFSERDIDVVIDDASHEYWKARATFEVAFPYLREGGLYILEDWGWAHWPGAWQDSETPILPGPALSNLVFEFVMMQASSPDVIRALHVNRYFAAVVRGPRELAKGPLEMNDLYLTRGKALVLL